MLHDAIFFSNRQAGSAQLDAQALSLLLVQPGSCRTAASTC
jgi:hypothetical protein